jgi:hypothetical protein
MAEAESQEREQGWDASELAERVRQLAARYAEFRGGL